jgi:endonuclease/exonuclease/phosphatase family metal-dependent hydrolase
MNLRVMTFNLRFENDRDGSNVWRNRRSLVLKIIRKFRPSILGTQEGMKSQLSYLEEHLKGYHLHTPFRVWDDTCQYPTLFVERERFEILGGKEFWLSKTPQVHRSKNWDSAFPRMMSYANLKDRESGKSFSAAVTHLDHIGEEARTKQAEIIGDWVNQKANPVILMGDFNDKPGSPAHDLLTGSQSKLVDSWQVLQRPEGKDSYTHHGFTGVPETSRIDWILTSRQWMVKNACIVRDRYDGRYPSDHFPYYVDLEWEDGK